MAPCSFDDATAYGNINGIDDPSMGWSRYAQVPDLSCCAEYEWNGAFTPAGAVCSGFICSMHLFLLSCVMLKGEVYGCRGPPT
jgi:hypothetical protein